MCRTTFSALSNVLDSIAAIVTNLVKPTAKMRALSTAALKQRADERATDIGPTITALQAAGATSLRAIAAGLNAQGIPTARGGRWSAVQVKRVLERI